MADIKVATTTSEDYSDVGLTIKTTRTGGRIDSAITIDVDLCRDDYGDVLDVAAVTSDWLACVRVPCVFVILLDMFVVDLLRRFHGRVPSYTDPGLYAGAYRRSG